MAQSNRAPKQWCLTKIEKVNTFENWKQNLQYSLSLDGNFAPYLVEGTQWLKKSRSTPYRGFQDDPETVPAAQRRSKSQKVNMLELMLGQIANYCPVISRSTIVKNSSSMDSIWQTIRLHYGFQSTGAHFIDFANIHYEPENERPEDLYQRLMAFAEDNLLRKETGITHHGDSIIEDEELTPSLENFIVLTWLRLINKDLPRLVKQRYGTELRSRTLASIKPEVSQALDSLLEEIQSSNDARIMKAAVSNFPSSFSQYEKTKVSTDRPNKVCPFCKQAGRPYRHFLSKCSFLPLQDRKYMAKSRQVLSTSFESDEEDSFLPEVSNEPEPRKASSINRVQIRQSPVLDIFCSHHTACLTIDSGATGNMIRASTAQKLGAKVTKSSQLAHQADGSSPLQILGETRLTFSRDDHELFFEGLVVKNLDTDILAGIPFMQKNDISIRPAKYQIRIGNDSIYTYGQFHPESQVHTIRRAQVLRAPCKSTTVWPGEYLEISVPEEIFITNDTFAIEPHQCQSKNDSCVWPPPSLIKSVSGKIRIPNLTCEPHSLKKHEHFGKIHPTFLPVNDDKMLNDASCRIMKSGSHSTSPSCLYSQSVIVDSDNLLPPDVKSMFIQTLKDYDSVFNPMFSGYNGASGPFQAKVNMGPVLPPQRKGRMPQYSKTQLDELQNQFDELESLGVFRKPEDVPVSVEYVNPSFLVKKSNGGFRLVTAFADVGRYSKPQPSLMPDVDSTLRQIAQWKYIIVTDLTKAFYQIPLSVDSMKYCGVVTPFRGVRVYARSAMGMPGSETALEELTCRILGDLVQQGVVAKLADDLYVGGNTPNDLLDNWIKVLQALQKNQLNLSATKTIIAPKQTSILGWIWKLGTLSANPHRIASLASCSPPTSVSGLRSFIGAFKVLSRVIKGTASILAQLDDAVAGMESKSKINWTDDLQHSFQLAQKSLSSNHTITLPRPADQLWIVTDGAQKFGLGATLYITRGSSLLLAGFFSAKIRKNQSTWLPCEIEALAIAAAIKHFSPYIIQSNHTTCILTDSKPCVQAYEKLSRGEFSSSPRVATFLSTASRYQTSIRHVSGSSILPSDFSSHNAADCNNPQCQICSFILSSENCVVRSSTLKDILQGTAKLPFTTRSTWLSIQSECPCLRRTHAHLKQGTRPSKKLTNVRDVKRYLNVASIAKDGLLVVKRNTPFAPAHESIIVPRPVLDGFITALHIRLDHPSQHQLKSVIQRNFFALDLDKSIERVTTGCYLCASLRKVPQMIQEQSTSDPPVSIGHLFSADVMKRNRQLVLVLREYVTSYTVSTLIENESSSTLRDALLRLVIDLHPLDGPNIVIRTDCAPGFTALSEDCLLCKYNISLEFGRTKNKNKNPIAEKAIQELEEEILRQDPSCRSVSPLLLALSTARLNARIRNRGLSAREMWTQRDQFSNDQIPLQDFELINQQHAYKLSNHLYSQSSKNPSGILPSIPDIHVGDLVYLYCDRSKTSPRNRYLVTSITGQWCYIRKFCGSQLRNNSYRVKLSECYKVPQELCNLVPSHSTYSSYDTDDEDLPGASSNAPLPPCIPRALSEPPPPSTPNTVDSTLLSDNSPVPDINGTQVTCDLHKSDESVELINTAENQDVSQLEYDSSVSLPLPTRSTRKRSVPNKFKDYVLY